MKPALGKGLGQLMEGRAVPGKVPPASAPETRALPGEPIKVEFGRGLNTLVSAKTPPPREEPEPARNKTVLPAWFFFSADLLLLVYTIAIVFDAERPFDFGTVVFCAVSIGLGALLAIAGVLRGQ